MNRKLMNRHHSHGDDQCIVYSKSEPKTFSKFVDNVIDELPVAIPAKRTCMYPNNPVEVLKDKGLLNISRKGVRTSPCSPDVELSFYSEESRCGETVKVFSSNHHFKHGQLVYSSTQELLPELPRKVERCNEWWETRGQRAISAGKGELQTTSEIFHSKSRRKKLTDILQDEERKKIMQRYENEARRRRLYNSRSLSPLDICDTTDQNRYLRSLRSEVVRKDLSPFTMHRRYASPERLKYHAAAVCKNFPPRPVLIRSSSEVSISSKESWIYSSPKRTIKETSRYEKQYKRTSSPKPKLKRGLFAIPDHTCCKGPQVVRCSHVKSSHWDTVRKCATSPRLKHDKYQRIPYGGDGHRIKSSVLDSEDRRREDYKRGFNNRGVPQAKTPPKSILGGKQERYPSKYSPHHKIRFSESTTGYKKRSGRREDEINSYHAKKQSHASYGHKYPKDDKTPNGKRDEHAGDHQMPSTSTEGETESDSSSRTHFYSAASEFGNEKENMEHYYSRDSKTSICSIHDNCQNEASRSSSRNFKSSTCQQSQADKTRHRKEYKEEDYKRSERSARMDEEARLLKDRHESSQRSRSKRRQINPNKVIHLEDSGRRLSQYYSKGKAILDSDKAFEDEEKMRSKKITFFQRSPKGSEYYESDSHEVTFREEPLDNHLRRVLREDYEREVDLIQNIVNKEALTDYREKYTDYSVHSDERQTLRTSMEREYDGHKLSIRKSYNTERRHGGCEACVIERLWAEEN